MYLDYSKLEFDGNGLPETPQLVLKTLGNKTIGIVPGIYNLKFNIKFSEPSEISFDIPSVIDGEPNPFYDSVTGYKQIYTDCYGIYETMNPSIEADGTREIKHVKGYSYEKVLEKKKLFLEEGTYNFWNPAEPENTVLGRILEVSPGWSVGYVSPSLIGRYRTFDQYDDYVLPFMYDHAPEKYRCVFVFDTYKKTINVYDADEERPTLPIYLDFDNLVKTIDIEEKSDELVTALRPYGADGLNIRDVNPIGSNWIYDLSYFIANGDTQEPLASKWNAWQRSILNRQQYYRGLVAMRASASARITAMRSDLTDRKGELDTLTAQQSVTIQAAAMESTSQGKAYQQSLLDDINQKIAAKRGEIAELERSIAAAEDGLDPTNPSSYTAQIQAIVNELSPSNYFTQAEYSELSNFFIEQDLTEDTFVATCIDTSASGSSSALSAAPLTLSGAKISAVDMTEQFGKQMYTITGGKFSLSGANNISGDIIRGTLETAADGNYVLSLYAGTLRYGGKTAPSGMVTMSGTMSGFASDIGEVTEDGVTTREGTSLSFTAFGSLYMTTDVSDYQQYCVEMELYEFAANTLSDMAVPAYEFSVDSANFLFAQEFAPFRDKLELGKGVYLNVTGEQTITPYIIEFELDFEERSKFSIIFSNRFKRHDNVNTLKDMIESSYSSSRSFDASKYIYNQTAGQATAVSQFMNSSLDAAKNAIIGAGNQSIVMNSSGFHVGGDSKYKLRIVNSMIAMTDDDWQTAKLAIGHFSTPEIGEYFGVNAEIIGGKLIIGNSLILENPVLDEHNNPTGVMQFKVDSTGAWLNNSTFVLQKDNGGKILLDPKYGIVAGTKDLFDTNGTTVLPSFIDEDGMIVTDKDGMPVNSNFFLDLRDGSAYFRANGTFIGNIYANNLYFNDGSGDVKTLINQATKRADFSGMDYIDLGGITLDGRTGNINFSGAGSITWGNNIPNKKRFAASTSGPWHDSMQSGDLYCCDWNYATGAWGSPYKFVGTDGAPGRNGSDASVTYAKIKEELQKAASIDSAYLTMDEVGAPIIRGGEIYGAKIYGAEMYANEFNVCPLDEGSYTGSFNIYGKHGTYNKDFHMFTIKYTGQLDASYSPYVSICSPGSARMYISGSGGMSGRLCIGKPNGNIDASGQFVDLFGNIDFSNATSVKWGKNSPVAVFA